ncbi:MAG: phospho-N-acetylmuramoyl-pentapeptide-transferase [Clostridiales Family XIII bacterium]|jgi:phospho-N-acetylmuramoyl-pentapeptide-transferase|nr:phospho-N-acetylmuramoyl-pentapeptide-transferase [Clostridiales Family XIII bacterium]
MGVFGEGYAFMPAAGAAAVSFAATAALTWLLIPLLRRLKAGQSIREDGPESHLGKSGTPTMGGLAIAAGVVAGCLSAWRSPAMLIPLACLLAFCALGFIDDCVKVRRKRSLGLTARQKLAVQLAIAAAAALYRYLGSEGAAELFVPFLDSRLDIGALYVPFAALLIVSAVNSVNLTDGLDGLASGVTAMVAAFFALAGCAAAGIYGLMSPGAGADAIAGIVACAAITGACLGFLPFNRKPAKVFMGDTGALALGGGLAAATLLLHMELLLPIAGFVYVAEALSVIIQVGSYKLRKKRVFRMSPLHHHFELCGWPEQKVVLSFCLATLLFCVLAFVAVPRL